ncbi:hypothetical protein [Aestuariimicrobium ganziense]|uniref:hypothetical protein n=1 Tax=Aestuariimicrobium ganziense TaxID=2773677 RepID=UPI0019411AAA|nr:hypothetical protein [Aestuariimicrobium ganziense]
MTEGSFIADTLQSVIAGMADTLTEAADELSRIPPLDSFGRPTTQYRIPYLDFEIGFRLQTQSTSSGRRALLFFAPATSSSSTNEVTSKISGRFVAVPPGEGLPLPLLQLTVNGTGATQTLSVVAANSAGELLAHAPVQLNVDLEASNALSAAAGVTDPRIAGNVTFDRAVVTTDATGRAQATVTLGAQLRVSAVVVVTAEVGSTMARITTGKGA